MLTNIMEKIDIKLLDFDFRIKVKFIGESYGFPGDTEEKHKGYHNQFKICLTNKDTKKRVYFNFYGSTADYNNGKAYIEEREFPFLLYCFVSDARSGLESFDDFCSEFGYDTDSRSAEKIHKLCTKSADKAYKLGIETDQQFCDLINELNEKFDC